jgi:protein-disulfide isomerase-like protein with CxxC motif
MKNKEINAVKMTRAIRNKNYEETKDLSRKELLSRYKKRGQLALEQFKKDTANSNVSD